MGEFVPLSRKLHTEWTEQARITREHIDDSLKEIDAALADEEEVRQTLQVSVDYGNLTPEERDECLASYHRERFREVWPDAS